MSATWMIDLVGLVAAFAAQPILSVGDAYGHQRPISVAAISAPQSGIRGRRSLPSGFDKASAQSLADRAGFECRVVTAVLLGQDRSGNPMYEASCADRPGLLLHDASPPVAHNCLALEAQADAAQSRSPRSVALPTCRFARNRDAITPVSRFAADAGISCDVDQARFAGLSPTFRDIYEVGCRNQSGYMITDADPVWDKTSCLVSRSQGQDCRFTTASENNARVEHWLVGRLPQCSVSDTRYMGDSGSGAFYEVRCRANDGFVIEVSPDDRVIDIVPCDQASGIGNGCQLSQGENVNAAPIAGGGVAYRQ